MSTNQRERDLVLAPNEYAYISDQTKGHIVAYVGPFKTSMANTDQPVYFDAELKRFTNCQLETAIKTFTTVPEGWYVTLKNPAIDGNTPTQGTANNQPKLNVGRKINIPGPAFFALWPGQMERVIKGHRLRSNQYLLVRVYEEEQAKKNWKNSVVMPQKEGKTKAEIEKENTILKEDVTNLPVGKLILIKGIDVSFYMPPTGLEVVRDVNNNYVRDAVTLERLEYCILLDEDGNKRFITGPDVVFPRPTEKFYVKNGTRKFKAIELSEISGIYVKVIAPYKEGKEEYKVGDELFITGKEQMIYFPRAEHALIKYGDQEIYQAVAIPPGEGRYYLNRKTGLISLKKGPAMFLPDPREAVIVQRILTKNQASLWYPGNAEVLNFNEKLREVAEEEKEENYLAQSQVNKFFKRGLLDKIEEDVSPEIASDEFVRNQSYTTARTITLDTKFEGAVTIDVWTGYAMLITSKTGSRKVIVGPQTYLLEYDENIAAIELSTGTPKNSDNLIKTVFLKVLHNKVSDIVQVETKDLCPIEIGLSYRVNFTGEPENWFNVENYVKFLTDHMGSRLRNAIKKMSVIDFYPNAIDVLRDTVLGKPVKDGKREKAIFQENGMQIYDLEIFDITLLDEDIEELLYHSQHEEMKQKLQLATRQKDYNFTKETEEIYRKIAIEKSETNKQTVDLQLELVEKGLLLSLAKINTEIKTNQIELEAKLTEQGVLSQINEVKRAVSKADEELALEISQKQLEQKLLLIKSEVDAIAQKAEAISPDFIAALQAFGDKALAEKMAESMAPLSIIGGKSIAEVFANMLQGTVLENVLKKQ